MNLGNTFSRLAGVLLLATAGVLLIYLPSWVIDHYRTISELGQVWGTVYLIAVGLGACLILASTTWIIWRLWGASIFKRLNRERRNLNPSGLSTSQQSQELEENLEHVRALAKDSQQDTALRQEIDPLVQELLAKREQQTLEIVAFGTISSGKSSILNLLAGRVVFATDVRGGTTTDRREIDWPGLDKVTLVDTPGLGEVDGEQHVWIAADSAKDADLVLLVVDGPLRDSEFQLLKKLGGMEKRIIVCLNKSDWYLPEDREKLLRQLRQQTVGIVNADEVVAIQAQAGTRPRHRINAAGQTIIEQVAVQPDIDPLAERMLAVLKHEGKQLLLANLLIQSRSILEKAKAKVQAAIDDRADATIDRYMWTSAGVAAVNPFPVVDILAGMGISTKMILDLAENYQQKVDLETASKWLGQMGKILIGVIGSQGVAVLTTSVVASLIKTIPGIGTIAGSLTQGVIQALMTKWIGNVFKEYFSLEMQTPEGGLAGIARRQWDQLTTLDELRKLVQTARHKLSDGSPS